MGGLSKPKLQFVFSGVLDCSFDASPLTVKNTFINVEYLDLDSSFERSCRIRSDSAPPRATYDESPSPIRLRPHLPTWDCHQFENHGLHWASTDAPTAGSKKREDSQDSRLVSTASNTRAPSAASEAASSGESRITPKMTFKHRGTKISHRTTVILRSIPDGYTRELLRETLDAHGFSALYDFMYMPMNFGTSTTFGYAFINFVFPQAAERFTSEFQNFSEWLLPSPNVAFVEWSGERQGLQGQIERYRNSPMMHKSVADEAKPILLENGVRVEFPAPTQYVKPMRVRSWKKRQAQCFDPTDTNVQGRLPADAKLPLTNRRRAANPHQQQQQRPDV